MWKEEGNLKIRKIYIDNYKGLKKKEINFTNTDKPMETVVLIGKNGTGKTSVLEFIFNFFNRMVHLSMESKDIFSSDNDIGTIEFDTSNEEKFKDFKINEWIRKGNSFQIKSEELPRIIYIPVEMNNTELVNKQQNFIPVPKFLQKIDTQIIENIPSYITSKIMREALLQSNITTDKVREKVFNEFNELFEEMELDIKLKEVSSDTLLPIFVKGDEKFDINNLSSGEKQVFLRILSLKMLDINNSVILIDEPETSLHPVWQQKIIKLYEKIGKNNQIIAATQSPFIIGGVKSENIIVFLRDKNGTLEIKSGNEFNEIYGQPVERVLQDIMETKNMRTPEIENKLFLLRKFVDEDKYETEEYLSLRKELGNILGHDIDLMMVDIDVKRRIRDKNVENN